MESPDQEWRALLGSQRLGQINWLLQPPLPNYALQNRRQSDLFSWYKTAIDGDYDLFALTYGLWVCLKDNPTMAPVCAYGAYMLGLVAISHGAYYEAYTIGVYLEDFAKRCSDSDLKSIRCEGPNDYMPPIISKEGLISDALRLRAVATGIGYISSRKRAEDLFRQLYEHLDANPDIEQRHRADREIVRYACRLAIDKGAHPETLHSLDLFLPDSIGGQSIRTIGSKFLEKVGAADQWVKYSPLDLDTAARFALVSNPDRSSELIKRARDKYINTPSKVLDRRRNNLVFMGLLSTGILIAMYEDRSELAVKQWKVLHDLCGGEDHLKHSRWMVRVLTRFPLLEFQGE